MAQGEYSEEDLFSTDTTDVQELDEMFSINDAESTEITAASEEDKIQAKKTGKAAPAKEPQKETEKEPEEEKIIGSELDEETQETSDKKTRITNQTDDETSDTSEYSELSKGLFKSGIWNRDDDEDADYFPETEEDFIERFQYEGQKMANGYISQVATRHGEEAKELFDAVFIQGVPVKEFVNKWQESQDFKAMDMTDEGNQERVVRTAYEQQGIPVERITEKIKKLKLSEDLEDEANTWHQALVKKQDADLVKIQQESVRKTEQKKAADLQYSTAVRNMLADKAKTQDFDGIPVNSKTAEQARDFLDTKKWKLNDGTLITDYDRMVMELKNPANLEALVKLSLLIDYKPGEPIKLKLDSVEKRKESKVAQEKFFNIKGGKKTLSSVPSKKIEETVDLLGDL
jgi:hypothetical protein